MESQFETDPNKNYSSEVLFLAPNLAYKLCQPVHDFDFFRYSMKRGQSY